MAVGRGRGERRGGGEEGRRAEDGRVAKAVDDDGGGSRYQAGDSRAQTRDLSWDGLACDTGPRP